MTRFLATAACLIALLFASGCVALQSQNCCPAPQYAATAPAFSAGPPTAVTASPLTLMPEGQQHVWMAPPAPLGFQPAPVSADSAGPVSFASTSPLSAATAATTVKLYYGTNRLSVPNPARMTSVPYQTNQYGQCEVSIPARHQFGQLERPSFWRLDFRESAARHVVLQHVEPLDAGPCLERIRNDLSSDDDSSLFVFVHGYNVTFEEAAHRTAQMAFDLRFPGVPLFYSWPSQGTLTGYGTDQSTADASAAPLAEFLTRVAQETGARKIHLVAHSLGNRALVGALARLGQTPQAGVHFNEVVFAAPDLDAAQFANEIAPRIRPVVDRVTIYSSGSDLALWASRLWHRTVRLGQAGPSWPKYHTFDWIDVIDTTAVGFEWFELGHSAYGSELLADLQRVLAGQPAGTLPTGSEAGRWTVTRPSPPPGSIGGGVPQTFYRFRPVGPWPAAPVDRWR